MSAAIAPYLDLREDARATLTSWRAPGRSQAELRTEFLSHLLMHPTAMWRHGPRAHFTASCVVLDADIEQALLALHRKVGKWLPFGGHLEAGDASVADGAAREVLEESGLTTVRLHGLVDLDRHALPPSAYPTCTEHLDMRYAGVDVAGRSRPVVTEESHAVRWWPVDALPRNVSADLPRLIEAARSLLRATPPP